MAVSWRKVLLDLLPARPEVNLPNPCCVLKVVVELVRRIFKAMDLLVEVFDEIVDPWAPTTVNAEIPRRREIRHGEGNQIPLMDVDRHVVVI
ncbi:hypothetical protein PIB30_000027 [Stylosanthes scabra]|uniref:Uncharacterized protein n=1 Tax=Stylosanthes scabra TaxID=79078 RepID=A0ABU6Q1U2_9FABA|nr:hypothetical protein [Stylosanthes scabra]